MFIIINLIKLELKHSWIKNKECEKRRRKYKWKWRKLTNKFDLEQIADKLCNKPTN